MKTHYATIKIKVLAEETKINTDELALSNELDAFYEQVVEWMELRKLFTSFDFEVEQE